MSKAINCPHSFHGMNLDRAIRFARDLGASVDPMRRTGEIRFSHPLMACPCGRVNGRRKDAPRSVTGWLKDLWVICQSRAASGGLLPA